MERRRNKRVNLFTTAYFSKHGDEKKFYGVVTDISYSGLFIQSANLLEIGDKVNIEMRINSNEIKLNGTVKRKKIVDNPLLVKHAKGGIGIQVDYMHPSVIDYINNRLLDEIK